MNGVQPPAPRPLRARATFVVSAVVPALYYAFACSVFLSSWLRDYRPSTLLWVLSEGLVTVLFMVRRPAREVSDRGRDWVVAVTGTFLVLAVRPADGPSALEAVGFPLQLLGMAAQIVAKLSLGRSFGIVAADRGLVERGAYRLVRHPIYAAYLLAHVGFLLCNPTAWNAGVYALAYALQVARIRAEEAVLARDAAYGAYAARVRWRLVPGLW